MGHLKGASSMVGAKYDPGCVEYFRRYCRNPRKHPIDLEHKWINDAVIQSARIVLRHQQDVAEYDSKQMAHLTSRRRDAILNDDDDGKDIVSIAFSLDQSSPADDTIVIKDDVIGLYEKGASGKRCPCHCDILSVEYPADHCLDHEAALCHVCLREEKEPLGTTSQGVSLIRTCHLVWIREFKI